MLYERGIIDDYIYVKIILIIPDLPFKIIILKSTKSTFLQKTPFKIFKNRHPFQLQLIRVFVFDVPGLNASVISSMFEKYYC